MAKFESLIYESNECTVKTGRKVADHVTSEHNTTRETVVKTGRRVADHATTEHNTTRETVVKTGRRTADSVNQHTSDEHAQTRRHSDDNADYIVNQLGGRLSGWQIFVSVILAALAGFGTWIASKGYILQNVLDKSGNVIGQEPYLPYIILLVVLAAIAAFFVAASILSFFGRRR